MIMMVLLYFWYISNIFAVCTLCSAPQNIQCKKERGCNLAFIKVSEPAQTSVYSLVINNCKPLCNDLEKHIAIICDNLLVDIFVALLITKETVF